MNDDKQNVDISKQRSLKKQHLKTKALRRNNLTQNSGKTTMKLVCYKTPENLYPKLFTCLIKIYMEESYQSFILVCLQRSQNTDNKRAENEHTNTFLALYKAKKWCNIHFSDKYCYIHSCHCCFHQDFLQHCIKTHA